MLVFNIHCTRICSCLYCACIARAQGLDKTCIHQGVSHIFYTNSNCVYIVTDHRYPDTMQVNQLDSNSLLVLLEGKFMFISSSYCVLFFVHVSVIFHAAGAVHIVNLEGALKSGQPHKTTFAHNVESVGGWNIKEGRLVCVSMLHCE